MLSYWYLLSGLLVVMLVNKAVQAVLLLPVILPDVESMMGGIGPVSRKPGSAHKCPDTGGSLRPPRLCLRSYTIPPHYMIRCIGYL